MKSKISPMWLAPLLAGLAFACQSDNTSSVSSAAPDSDGHKAITTEVLEPYSCGSIARMHTFGGVFLASQPTADDLSQAKMGGVKTVVNMRHEKELKFDEAAHVASLELNYLNPAWNGPDELTDTMFDEYREVLRTAPRPMLLHCGSANRVGAVWLPYRVLDDGLTVEAALAEAKTVGMRSPDYERKALDYIRRMQR